MLQTSGLTTSSHVHALTMATKYNFVFLIALSFLCQIIPTPVETASSFDRDVSAQSPALQRERRSANNLEVYENEFLEKLLEEYGTDGVVTVNQLTKLVKNIRVNAASKVSESGDHGHDKYESRGARPSEGTIVETTLRTETERRSTRSNCSSGDDCQSQKCLTMVEIFEHHSLSPQEPANGTKLQRMSPTILYQLQNPLCGGKGKKEKPARPPIGSVWGYGFLCVTLINLCALMGMFFLPLMRRSFYKNMLLFMVALAVGTLTGSGVLFLIPESFEMTSPESPYADYYIWRCLAIVGGIYLFFLVERLLKMIMKRRQNKEEGDDLISVKEIIYKPENPKEKEEMQDMPIASVPTHSVHLEESMNMSFKPVPNELPCSGCKDKKSDCLLHKDSSSARLMDHTNAVAVSDSNVQMTNGHSTQSSPQHHGHSHGANLRDIRSVAWMVIFGDGLHNFIDGLSIGAAFTGSIMTGVSVSLAIICEELPHELGDFAILLNSGMTMRQALGYNFLSACMCYLGLIVGILVGEATTGAVWIFAVAGGMFLYIALVDMLPEVNHAADEEEAATGATWSIFLLQNAGILSGLGIMVLLAVFSGKIDLSHLEP